MGRPRTKPRATDIKGPLGDRICLLRQKAGMTQGDLAKASGVSKVFLGTVERGEKGASVETLEKLAKGLGVPPFDLLRFGSGEGQGTPAERLGRKVAVLARAASEDKVARFEKIARLYFAEEPAAPSETSKKEPAGKSGRARRTPVTAKKRARR